MALGSALHSFVNQMCFSRARRIDEVEKSIPICSLFSVHGNNTSGSRDL